MRKLLYKEFSLTINKFFLLLPLIISLLFFIPNWIFSLVFMYFFWISIPQILVGYAAQQDFPFISMLPASKKDVVISKTLSIYILELLHIVLGLVFGLIHNAIYGQFNLFMEINPAFFGVMFIMYGIFNIIVFPQFYKTAYKFGLPVIFGVVATILFAGILEYGVIKIPAITNILKSSSSTTQLLVLGIGILVGVVFSAIATKQSVKNYKSIK